MRGPLASAPLPVPWPLGVFLATTLLAAGRMAHAQELDEQGNEPVARNVIGINEANFDAWVFGNGPKRASAREHLDSLLAVSVADVERCCSLSGAQREKLLLAGRGDIKRFLDRVAEAREVFDRLRHDQNNMNEVFQETQPLAATLGIGLFAEGSLFAKALGTTLDPEQGERYRGVLLERSRFRYRAKVSLALAKLDDAVGFTAEQSRRLAEVILEETTPPARPAGQFEANVVLLKIAGLREAKVRPILDDARWKALSQQLQQARGMEPFLRDNGHLDEPGPAGPGGAKKD